MQNERQNICKTQAVGYQRAWLCSEVSQLDHQQSPDRPKKVSDRMSWHDSQRLLEVILSAKTTPTIKLAEMKEYSQSVNFDDLILAKLLAACHGIS